MCICVKTVAHISCVSHTGCKLQILLLAQTTQTENDVFAIEHASFRCIVYCADKALAVVASCEGLAIEPLFIPIGY